MVELFLDGDQVFIVLKNTNSQIFSLDKVALKTNNCPRTDSQNHNQKPIVIIIIILQRDKIIGGSGKNSRKKKPSTHYRLFFVVVIFQSIY
jgi:hypothetical protein